MIPKPDLLSDFLTIQKMHHYAIWPFEKWTIVNDQKSDRPVFEWSFSGHFMVPVFEFYTNLDRFGTIY
jgi:hypothetical protein